MWQNLGGKYIRHHDSVQVYELTAVCSETSMHLRAPAVAKTLKGINKTLFRFPRQ